MKKKTIIFMVLITILNVGIVAADMRSERNRVDIAEIMVQQQGRVDRALSEITTVKNRLTQIKTRAQNQFGATEAAEVQAMIDAIKTQLTDYAAAF